MCQDSGALFEDEGPCFPQATSYRLASTVFSEEKKAGYYDLEVPIRPLASGTYFLRLETENRARTKKIVIGRQ